MKYYWTMKGGERIDVDEMDLNHLRNVLKMLIRNQSKLKKISNIDRSFMEAKIESDYNEFCDATESDLY